MRRAFGLLEVMFATAIFIVVAGSLISLSQLSLRNAALSTHRSQATNLAQDGIETVRQLRDTAWINRTLQGTSQEKDWLTYPTCNAQALTERQVVTVGTEYEICYMAGTNSFGLRPAQANFDSLKTEDTAYIRLKDTEGRLDPGAPLYFKRIVVFDAVANTNAGACGGSISLYTGLQLLGPTDDGTVCSLEGVESSQFIKVKVIVSWRDFDKDWSVALESLLTNWRSN